VSELSAKRNRFWRLPLSSGVADRKRSEHGSSVHIVAKARWCGRVVAQPEFIRRWDTWLDLSR